MIPDDSGIFGLAGVTWISLCNVNVYLSHYPYQLNLHSKSPRGQEPALMGFPTGTAPLTVGGLTRPQCPMNYTDLALKVLVGRIINLLLKLFAYAPITSL